MVCPRVFTVPKLDDFEQTRPLHSDYRRDTPSKERGRFGSAIEQRGWRNRRLSLGSVFEPRTRRGNEFCGALRQGFSLRSVTEGGSIFPL
jgi:hypothetical protein